MNRLPLAHHTFKDGASVTLDYADCGDYTHVVYTTASNGYTYACHNFRCEQSAREGFAAKVAFRENHH